MEIQSKGIFSERNFIVTNLIIGAFIAILNQTLLITAVPSIMTDLNIPFSQAQWLTTGFFLVNGIMIPVTAFLINKFETRKLYIYAMTMFTIGTLIAAVAVHFPTLLIGRIVQASGAGIMMPLTQVVLLTMFPVENRGRAMGLFGLVIGFAPAIGPTLSGYIVEIWPWRSLFLVVAPIAVFNIIFAFIFMRNVVETTNPKVDILSIILSTLGFGGLLYGFSVAGTAGWMSMPVILPITAGGVIVFFFVTRQLKLEQPILNLSVFTNKHFLISTLIGVIVFTSMVSANNIIPVLMQDMLGYSPLESGLALLPGALMMGIMSFAAGYFFDKYGIKMLAVISLSLILVTSVLLTFLSEETPFKYIVIVYTIRLFATGLSMMPLSTFAMNALSTRMISHGTSINNTMRQIGSSLFTALLVTVMTGVGIRAAGTGDLTVQDQITGVNASFIVASVVALIGLVMVFFLKDNKKVKDQTQKR